MGCECGWCLYFCVVLDVMYSEVSPTIHQCVFFPGRLARDQILRARFRIGTTVSCSVSKSTGAPGFEVFVHVFIRHRACIARASHSQLSAGVPWLALAVGEDVSHQWYLFR